jgi:hypothetical protein
MSQYRYLTTDLVTGMPLADLPLSEVSIEEEINEPGSMSASVNLSAIPAGDGIETVRAGTVPARTAIYVMVDGQTLWGGIIWKRRLRGNVLGLECSGFLSYFAKSRVTATQTFAQVEQFVIVRTLLGHAASKPGGNIGIDLGSGGSGRLRDRTYTAEDRKPILEAVQELAAVADGFDIAIRPELDFTDPAHKLLLLGHPELGRPAEGTDLMIEYPGSITEWEWPEEGDRMITTAYVRGELSGEATIPPFAEVTDDSLIAAGYPRLEEEFPAGDGTITQAALDERAAAMLETYGRPVALPSFTVASGEDHTGPHPTSYSVGDHFRVRITDPEWMPAGEYGQPGYDGPMRLIRRSIVLGGGSGGERATLTMRPVSATTAGV